MTAQQHDPSSPAHGPALLSDVGASEEELLAALLAGDRRAAEELVGRTYELVFASLVKLTGGDRALAEDLTQDTYARAWRSLSSFDGRAKLSTWLYRIAYNTFLNHIRRPARTRSFEEGEAESLRSGEPGQVTSAIEHQERQQLRSAVLALPEDLRYTVTARFWGGLSAAEIAKLEGISAVAIRKRLRRAYKLLGADLEDDDVSGQESRP